MAVVTQNGKGCITFGESKDNNWTWVKGLFSWSIQYFKDKIEKKLTVRDKNCRQNIQAEKF